MTVKESLKKLGASKRKVARGTYLISFDDNTEMCKTLLRFAEHYESPQFRNKIFTLKEFKKWYRTTRDGKFTYYRDWAGFNIPSYVFAPFKEGKFNPLSEKEKLFLDVINNIKDELFYVIVSVKNNRTTIKHETAHALFYLNKEYKEKALKILTKINWRRLKKQLIIFGYCKEVLSDEANACIVDGMKGVDKTKYTQKLCSLFDEYIERERG